MTFKPWCSRDDRWIHGDAGHHRNGQGSPPHYHPPPTPLSSAGDVSGRSGRMGRRPSRPRSLWKPVSTTGTPRALWPRQSSQDSSIPAAAQGGSSAGPRAPGVARRASRNPSCGAGRVLSRPASPGASPAERPASPGRRPPSVRYAGPKCGMTGILKFSQAGVWLASASGWFQR